MLNPILQIRWGLLRCPSSRRSQRRLRPNSTYSTILGSVSDEQGGMLPGVTVRIVK